MWYRILLTLVIGLPLLSAAQVDEYLTAQSPRRLALVVGNSSYDKVEKLPGSTVDADRIAAILRGLGFQVHISKDVPTRGQFLENVFLPFLAQIEEGDVALFYFSGHGFTYGGENYLAPLQFPEKVPSADVFFTFLSASSIHQRINERKPSFIVMLLDACRSIPGFVVTSSNGTTELIAKGLAEARSPAENTVIGYSSDIGTESWGSKEPKLSVYTSALDKFLPSAGREFEDVKRDVRFEVKFNTGRRQIPWFSDSSSAEFYMKPTPQILAQQRTLWEAALGEGTRRAVAYFLDRYGSGPYGAAARRWLRSNPDAAEVRASSISPLGPESLWKSYAVDLSLFKFTGAVRPRSTVSEAQSKAAQKRLDVTQQQLRYAKVDSDFRDLAGASVLVSLGEAVVANEISAKASPSDVAATIEDLRPGKRLLIKGYEQDANRNVWLRAATPGTNVDLYLPQSRSGSYELGDIGEPILETYARPNREGLKSLIDEREITSAIRSLSRQGKTVKWVSISAPSSQDSREAYLNSLRAIHLRAVLAKAGIDRNRITTIEGVSIDESLLRVRFFGDKP